MSQISFIYVQDGGYNNYVRRLFLGWSFRHNNPFVEQIALIGYEDGRIGWANLHEIKWRLVSGDKLNNETVEYDF